MDPAFHVSIMSLKNQQKQNARRSVANDDHWKKTTSLRNRGGKIILLSKNKLAFGSTDFVVFRELGLVSGFRHYGQQEVCICPNWENLVYCDRNVC